MKSQLSRLAAKNPDGLSDMEIKVLLGTCTGLSSAKIAPMLFKSPRTVEKCRKDLYKKFYVKDKHEFIQVAGKLFKLP